MYNMKRYGNGTVSVGRIELIYKLYKYKLENGTVL